MSVIYEVNLILEEKIENDFLKWLEVHIQQMLEIDGFISARIFKDSEQTLNYIVHYEVQSQQHLNHYFNHQAKEMREDGLKRFPGQFQANRRILSHLS